MVGMPKPTFLLSTGYFCDTRYKWFQALGRYLDAPVWALEMPHPGVKESQIEGAREHDVQFLVEDLREFAAFLERFYPALVAQGIGVWLGVQAMINIGVNMGVLPTKGLTLPFLSFGGSGVVMNCVAAGILLRVDYENRRVARGLPV